jgi:hypothetical protein
VADPGEQEADPDVAALHEQLAAFDVDQFVVSAASTIASLAYAKLEREDLPQAKKAIDALASLVPHLEGELADDLALALTRLQVAYAEAAG